jgi:hypothetical protein
VDLGSWARERLSNIRGLLACDTARARVELARHAGPVTLVPTERGYQVEGSWNLLGSPELVAGGRNERKLVELPYRVLASDVAA